MDEKDGKDDKSSGGGSIVTAIVVLWILLAIVFVLGGIGGRLASTQNAVAALTAQGFSNPQLVGRHIYLVQLQGCNISDSAKLDFLATNPLKQRVSVSVCESWPGSNATVIK